ncbi:hypothetical protein PISMIDRAFT_687071 [Pisolithus microcarpus 441]|uniref:Uncharacterized protein n=1 Tax=Pisolithus microcarpus 441 TaxID=765257 RepID=A0A0C9YPF8_9AGAM|nr:hypothetical protein PISMIDRAFT_687071 [Pisolithus microcarpus 441]
MQTRWWKRRFAAGVFTPDYGWEGTKGRIYGKGFVTDDDSTHRSPCGQYERR